MKMNIKVINRGKKVILRLRGYLDGSSAWEIIRKVDNYKNKQITLDFSGIRDVHTFGWHTLKARIGKRVILQGINFQILREL